MTKKLFSLLSLSLTLSLNLTGQDHGQVKLSPPEVGKNQSDLYSRFKNVKEKDENQKKKSWWEIRDANKDRKGYTVAKPPQLEKEGVTIEVETVNEAPQNDTSSSEKRFSLGLSQPSSSKSSRSIMPKYFVALKGGAMDPELSQWDRFYEDSYMKNLGLEVGYHLKWGISLLARAQSMKTKGQGLLISTNALGADVDYKFYPLQAGLQWEFAFTPRDLVRPFFSGGFAHAIYRQDVSDGRRFKGYVTGSFAKAGLLLDLSRLDEHGIRRGQELFQRVDLLLEVERLWLNSSAVSEDLGGFNFGGGVRIGF